MDFTRSIYIYKCSKVNETNQTFHVLIGVYVDCVFHFLPAALVGGSHFPKLVGYGSVHQKLGLQSVAPQAVGPQAVGA